MTDKLRGTKIILHYLSGELHRWTWNGKPYKLSELSEWLLYCHKMYAHSEAWWEASQPGTTELHIQFFAISLLTPGDQSDTMGE